MMYKLGHYLFDWHYIIIVEHGWIRRVARAPSGLHHVNLAGNKLVLKPDGTFLDSHYTWVPLTWNPNEKYKAIDIYV